MERIGGQTSGRGDFAAAVNVGDGERMLSAVAGGAALLYGLGRGALGGWALAALGAALAYRGLTGHCTVYQALGVDTATREGRRVTGNLGIKVEQAGRLVHQVRYLVGRPCSYSYGVDDDGGRSMCEAWSQAASLPTSLAYFILTMPLPPPRRRNAATPPLAGGELLQRERMPWSIQSSISAVAAAK